MAIEPCQPESEDGNVEILGDEVKRIERFVRHVNHHRLPPPIEMTPSFNGRGIGVRVVTEAKYNVNRSA